MVVEDTTAFVERLEIAVDDKRVEKQRRHEARARIETLAVATDLRVATQMLRDLESHEASRREVGALRSHVDAKQRELGRKRERLALLVRKTEELERRRRRVVMLRLHSADHFLDFSEERYELMSQAQKVAPRLVLRKDGRQWWWYRDRFWWDDGRRSAREVESSILESDLIGGMQRHLLQEARERTLGTTAQPPSGTSIPVPVRQSVWRRDLGRCVDCGSTEQLRFEPVTSVGAGAPSADDLELRCQTCSALREQPGAASLRGKRRA